MRPSTGQLSDVSGTRVRPSNPRPVHAVLPGASTSLNHEANRWCACQPVQCIDLAEPARLVWVHRRPGR